ncbi:unnamed protein product, partial [marine sediment metagenome]
YLGLARFQGFFGSLFYYLPFIRKSRGLPHWKINYKQPGDP